MNSIITKQQTVFDKSKINSGSRIEIEGVDDRNDLIKCEAIVTRVDLDKVEFASIDLETRELIVDVIYTQHLSSDTQDGWTIRLKE